MGSLGQLGVAKVRDVDTFDWFDECDLRIGNVSSLLLVDFIDRAVEVDEQNLQAGMALLKDAFRSIVDEADFPRFWAACLRERQEADDLMRLMQTLIEGLSGRPTSRRSGSRPGRRADGAKLKVVSSSRKVRDRFERHGRADLALAVRDVERAG